ncbi:hypothetical protein R8510_05176 [Ralstonia chuxiongensis]|nr:hypothetical protein R8510_05176 [Ralstonia chuxiongensis]
MPLAEAKHIDIGVESAQDAEVWVSELDMIEQIGSGLGLSIVQTIANRIGAEIHLDFADGAQQTGLIVTVIVPMKEQHWTTWGSARLLFHD